MEGTRIRTSVLVIGSGIAGCTAALVLADAGLDVTLLTADSSLDGGNSALAQGGIVYKADNRDAKKLEQDILTAGWKHNNPRAVRHLARKGPDAVEALLFERLAIPFTRAKKGKETTHPFDLIREGGHSAPRILHSADFTGKTIMQYLVGAVEASEGITVQTRRTAVDLLTSRHHAASLEFKYHLTNQCVGAYVFNQDLEQMETILADYTVLATGGAGQVFLHTTNVPSSIGAGMVMAARAKAHTLGAEYIQFHPTVLFHHATRRFLVSEAVRGAGARLVNVHGEAFMARYDSRADLAPRDIVTRAIQAEMLRTDAQCVYLNAAEYIDDDIAESFPTITGKCREIGIDMTRDPVPVVPAAHYFCGGVLTDLQGRTTLSRLYAAGECACTGLHGANRLASTSLLEGIVWGMSAGQDIMKQCRRRARLSRRLVEDIPDWVSPGTVCNEDPALIAQDWATIRHTMWNYVGITRTDERLQRAFDDIRTLHRNLQEFYTSTPLSKPLIDLFHGCYAAYIITLAALRNPQSKGCHYRVS